MTREEVAELGIKLARRSAEIDRETEREPNGLRASRARRRGSGAHAILMIRADSELFKYLEVLSRHAVEPS